MSRKQAAHQRAFTAACLAVDAAQTKQQRAFNEVVEAAKEGGALEMALSRHTNATEAYARALARRDAITGRATA